MKKTEAEVKEETGNDKSNRQKKERERKLLAEKRLKQHSARKKFMRDRELKVLTADLKKMKVNLSDYC